MKVLAVVMGSLWVVTLLASLVFGTLAVMNRRRGESFILLASGFRLPTADRFTRKGLRYRNWFFASFVSSFLVLILVFVLNALLT